jgi:hypothetical protein
MPGGVDGNGGTQTRMIAKLSDRILRPAAPLTA